MNILLDVIVVLTVLIPIAVSAKRGFVKSISKIAALIAAIIVAVTLTPYVCEKVDGAGYREALETKLTETIAGLTDNDETAASDIENEQSELYKFLGNIGVEVDSLKEKLSESTENAIGGISESASVYLAQKLIYFICFAAVFLASYIIALILLWLISKFAKLPVLKSCDKALGFLMGLIYAIILTTVFIGVFDAILPYLSSAYPDLFKIDIAEKTVIYKFISSVLADAKNLFF